MVREIVWTKRANHRFNAILSYLEDEWGERVTKNFVKKTYGILIILTKFPEIGTLELKDKKIRGILITKHNRLFYRISGNKIILLNFFDTRFGPDRKKF